jgi:hypothetical protein
MAKPTQRRKNTKPVPARKRATTVERAEQALEQASDKPPPRTDDPSRDKAHIQDGAIKPLKHAD